MRHVYDRQTGGYTLIEMLVVLTIVLLVSITLFNVIEYTINEGNYTKAQSDINEIADAMTLMVLDTGAFPTRESVKPSDFCAATGANEVQADQPEAGIVATDGNFTNWNGPYMPSIPPDPWGGRYFFDADYQCFSETRGCEGVDDAGLNSGVIVSCGPNQNTSGPNGCAYDTDNIVYVLCRD